MYIKQTNAFIRHWIFKIFYMENGSFNFAQYPLSRETGTQLLALGYGKVS